MWERWNGDKMLIDPGMNSFNHYAYGAVAEWMYRYAAGIDTVASDAGFHTILLHPNFDARLGNLDFSYESPYGTIHSAWAVTKQDVIWNLTIPANTSARMVLPQAQAKNYRLYGKPLSKSKFITITMGKGGESQYEIPAGTYTFTVVLPHS